MPIAPLMEAVVLVAAIAAGPTAEYEQDGVAVSVTVTSHVYEWTVTNVDAEPITSFAVDLHNTYSHRAPDGWEIDAGAFHLRAWTTDRRRAIGPGRSATFTAQVSSSGAVLGLRPLTLGVAAPRDLAAGGGYDAGPAPIVLPAVWAPRPMPRYIIGLIAAVVAAIGLVHACLVGARTHRSVRHDHPPR